MSSKERKEKLLKMDTLSQIAFGFCILVVAFIVYKVFFAL